MRARPPFLAAAASSGLGALAIALRRADLTSGSAAPDR